jgi:hypothetical protein
MRTTSRGAASLVMALVLGACAAPTDVPTPTVAAALPVETVAPVPTPVMSPSAVPAATVVAAGAAPPVDCGGAAVSTAIIDYVANAQGVPDILAATQGFVGVLPTDTIVVEPTATVVVRGGRPIWRGDWFDGGRGYLLNTAMACPDAGIRSH